MSLAHGNLSFPDVEKFFKNSNGPTPHDNYRKEMSPILHPHQQEVGGLTFQYLRGRREDHGYPRGDNNLLKLTPIESPNESLFKMNFNPPRPRKDMSNENSLVFDDRRTPYDRPVGGGNMLSKSILEQPYTPSQQQDPTPPQNQHYQMQGRPEGGNISPNSNSNNIVASTSNILNMMSTNATNGNTGTNIQNGNGAHSSNNMHMNSPNQAFATSNMFDMSSVMVNVLSKMNPGYKNMQNFPAKMVFMSKISQLSKGSFFGAMPKIGAYTKEERLKKIQQYKNKLQRWRTAHPVKRKFTGRSKAAVDKPRLHGRFVKLANQGKQIRKHGRDSEEMEEEYMESEMTDQVNDLLFEFESKL